MYMFSKIITDLSIHLIFLISLVLYQTKKQKLQNNDTYKVQTCHYNWQQINTTNNYVYK